MVTRENYFTLAFIGVHDCIPWLPENDFYFEINRQSVVYNAVTILYKVKKINNH